MVDLGQKVERIAGLLEDIKTSRQLAEMIERDCASLSGLLASRDREVRSVQWRPDMTSSSDDKISESYKVVWRKANWTTLSFKQSWRLLCPMAGRSNGRSMI